MAKLPPPPPGFDVVPENKEGASRFAQPNLAAEPPPPPGYEPVDTRGWGEWAYDTVVGREDPRYKGLPTVDEALTAEGKRQGKFFTGPEQRQIRGSIPFAVTDEQYRDVMKNALGERFLGQETDKYGNHVVVYRGDDGHEKRAYVNRPGLDSEDISRGLVQAVPYVVGGAGAAATKLGLMGRAALQGVLGAGTSAGQDVAATAFGSEQGIDPYRAVVTGAASSLGEAVSPIVASAWRRFVTEPALYDAAAGQLTPKGVQVAIEAGLDPSALRGKLAQEFTKTYARTGDAAAAGRQYATHELGIDSTIGQRTKDAQHLLEEGAMRRGLHGEGAKQEMRAFDERQAQQIRNAVLGDSANAGAGNTPGSQGIAARLNPARDLERMTTPEMGAAIQQGLETAQTTARQAENAAWRGLDTITAHPQAKAMLPDIVEDVVRQIDVPPKGTMSNTPVAFRMAQIVDDYVHGTPAPQEFRMMAGRNMPETTVDQMRRRLLDMMQGAEGNDRRLAGQLYDRFNTWIGQAADSQLLAGHPDAAAALRNARQISREIKDLFSPREGGKQTAAAGMINRVMEKADSPEAVVQTLFGSGPNSGIKMGTVDALDRMKTALSRFGGPEGQNVWNDIRTAYWTRLVTDRKGDLMSPTVMLNTLKTAFNKQDTVLKRLYSREEIGEMRKLMRALEQITYKDPNPSGSGYAIAQFTKQFLGTLLDAIPFGQKLVIPLKAAYSISGLPEASGRAAARAATSQRIPSATPPSLAGYAGAAENLYRSKKDQ